MDNSELVKQNGGAIDVTEAGSATALLAVIAMAARDPNVDVGKMERLLAMQERVLADQRREAFAGALARLQARLPQIAKNGRIVVKGTLRSRYASIEDIDVAIRPLLAEEGFALSFDEDSAAPDARSFVMSCRMSHRAGHSETKRITLPLDSSDFRTAIQSRGSTTSYARRYLIKMHLNLVEQGEDDDGQGGSKPITRQQADDLRVLMQDAGADEARFLRHMGVESLEAITTKELPRAIAALEAKKRAGK